MTNGQASDIHRHASRPARESRGVCLLKQCQYLGTTMVCSSVEAISIRFLVREKLEKIVVFSSFVWVWKTHTQSGQFPFNPLTADDDVRESPS